MSNQQFRVIQYMMWNAVNHVVKGQHTPCYSSVCFIAEYLRVTLKPPLFLARNVAFSCCFKDIACDECRSCILKGFLDARGERS